MKHLGLIHLIFTLILFQSPLPAIGAESDGSVCKKLVWSDEFNIDGPIDSLYWNFEKGFVRLLDLALGGDHGGEISADALPMKYEIDYVRIYQ